MVLKSAKHTLKINKLAISKLCVQVVFFVVACFAVLETRPKNLDMINKHSVSELHLQTPTFPRNGFKVRILLR